MERDVKCDGAQIQQPGGESKVSPRAGRGSRVMSSARTPGRLSIGGKGEWMVNKESEPPKEGMGAAKGVTAGRKGDQRKSSTKGRAQRHIIERNEMICPGSQVHEGGATTAGVGGEEKRAAGEQA